MKTFLMLFVLTAALVAQPVATLPQHIIDGATGELIVKAAPEADQPFKFRCLKSFDQQSCTTLAPKTLDGKNALKIVRGWVEKVVKDSGVGSGNKVTLEYEESAGFAGGFFFVVRTERGTERINAIWPALWRMLPGETDNTVRARIAQALKDVL